MKRWQRILAFLALVATMTGNQLSATAAEKGQTGFAVNAQLPANQLDTMVSYFYLEMKPGQKQVLQVDVVNRGDEDIYVGLEANTAFTSRNGVIDYSASSDRDPSLEVDFAQMVQIEAPVLLVPRQGKTVAKFILTMPEEPLKGEVLGGLKMTKLDPKVLNTPAPGEPTPTPGMRIENVFAYVVAVRLKDISRQGAEVPNDIKPLFAFTGVQMGTVAGMPTVEMNLANPVPLVVSGMAVEANIYPEAGGESVLHILKESLSMAPNSAMPLTHYLTRDTVPPGGKYQMALTITLNGESWSFKAPLEIK